MVEPSKREVGKHLAVGGLLPRVVVAPRRGAWSGDGSDSVGGEIAGAGEDVPRVADTSKVANIGVVGL